jgi:hypothetical protein
MEEEGPRAHPRLIPAHPRLIPAHPRSSPTHPHSSLLIPTHSRLIPAHVDSKGPKRSVLRVLVLRHSSEAGQAGVSQQRVSTSRWPVARRSMRPTPTMAQDGWDHLLPLSQCRLSSQANVSKHRRTRGEQKASRQDESGKADRRGCRHAVPELSFLSCL